MNIRKSPGPAVAGVGTSRQVPPARRARTSFALIVAVTIFWLLVLRVVVPGSFDYGKVDMAEVAARDSLFNKITWLTFALVSAGFIFANAAQAVRLLRATNTAFLLLLGFSALSVGWSIDPGATLARLFHALTVLLCCLSVTLIDWDTRRFQSVTRPVFTLILLGSLGFALASPELAFEAPIAPDTKFYLHGLADQKNQLGALASMAVIFWFHGWAAREVRLLSALLGGAAAVACLLLCRSSTSIVASVFVCGILLLLLRLPARFRRYVPFVIGGLVVITLAYGLAILGIVPGLDALLTPITNLTGKDNTFSNRTQIWQLVVAHIKLSPFLGSGYGAYWTGPQPTSPSFIFVNQLFFYPGECHNGYLEVLNDLGFAGLCLLLAYIAILIRDSLALLRSNYSQAALYLALLLQQLLTNLSESHWFFISSDFAMITLATLCIARNRLDAARRAAPAGLRARQRNAAPSAA